MAVHFIIDAGCDLNADQARDLGVTLIPMTINFAGKEYKAGVDISTENDSFYCYPTKQNIVTKLAFATEELYAIAMEKKLAKKN